MNDAQTSIRETIQNYVEGYLRADGSQLARAFHPETRLHTSSEQGKLERTEMPDWLSSLAARKATGDIRTGEYEIAFVDVSGDSAVAKVILRLPKLQFTDYLSFLRVSPPSGVGERKWLIAGKIYTVG